MCASPPATTATSPVDKTNFRTRVNICGITRTVITLKEIMQTTQSVMGPGGQKYEEYFRLIKQKDFCAGAVA